MYGCIEVIEPYSTFTYSMLGVGKKHVTGNQPCWTKLHFVQTLIHLVGQITFKFHRHSTLIVSWLNNLFNHDRYIYSKS